MELPSIEKSPEESTAGSAGGVYGVQRFRVQGLGF